MRRSRAAGRSVFFLLVWIVAFPGAQRAGSFPWNPPERVTFNSVQDRTTSGSLMQDCFGNAAAVWMQDEPGLGWKVVWSERMGTSGWTAPQPIDPGMYGDADPQLSAFAFRVTWQRGSGDAAEIVHARRDDPWTVETITSNATPDVSPAIPRFSVFGANEHVVWAGLDSVSAQGKIFHAENDGNGWQTEVLAGSDLGGFWTGAAPKISVSEAGILHVVYRGGDFGNYHLHHARKESGSWSYATLLSPNVNDLTADVHG